MKKKLAVVLIMCLGMILTGCGVKTTPEIIMPDKPLTSSVKEDNSGSKDDKKEDKASDTGSGNSYKIYLITMDLTDSYWQSIDKGCQQAASEIGNITYKWIGPDSHDDKLQSECVDKAVEDGANAILIAANSADGVNDSLKKAADKGCKIVYVDSAASYDCVTALATDNEKAGEKAGKTLIDELNSKGVSSGKIGVMGVTKDTASCVAREKGFRKAFEGSKYTLADTVYMNDDSKKVASAVKKDIKDGYVGFFGCNEGTTVAIGEELRSEEKESNVVGFDTSDAVLSLVSDGYVYATMQQKPETMGHDGLTIAVQALDGKVTDTNTSTDTGVDVITKESM